VVRLLERYLEQLEQGTPLQPEAWLAEHADVGGPLAECLATLELLHHTAMSLGRGSPTDAVLTAKGPALGQLGDFRLLREVGRGGMGIVYAAEQLSLRRTVALKVVPWAGALDARQLQRFHNEALTASQLHHAHIVDVFGAGCAGGVHYYAMRYIEGQTLAQLIARMRKVSGLEPASGPNGEPQDTCVWPTSQDAATAELADRPAGEAGCFPAPPKTGPGGALTTEGATGSPGFFRAAAEIGVQVAEALDYAHEHGVVHRDIKPSNVILDGQAWVTDFGLARLRRQVHLTQSGDVVGTLRYMSPEQALGKRDLLDHRSDIYSLGATLYELLTLRFAVPGDDSQEILRRIASEEPARLSHQNRAVPPDLEAIVLKAIAKAPEERYATAQELADDLRCFLNAQPVQARRPTRLQQAGKWARRHRRPLLTAAGVAILMLTLAVVLLALSNAQIRLQSQEQQTRAAEREKTLQRAMARWNETRITRQARQPGQRYGSLEALAGTVRDLRSVDQLEAHRLDLRNDAIASLTLWDVRAVNHLAAAPRLALPRFDPLGRHYVSADAANAVSWRRRGDDQVVHRWQWEGTPCLFLEVSPDGRYVFALCRDDRQRDKGVCRVWDTGTGRLVLKHLISHRCGHAFRPDSKGLALAQADGSVVLCDLGTGREQPVVPAGPMPERLAFHPKGQYLAMSFFSQPDVVVLDLATRKVKLRLVGDRYQGSLAWNPDGSLLAVGSVDTNIYLCRFPGGKLQAVLRGHGHIVTGVEFHPSGRLLASCSHDDTTRLWSFAPGGDLVLPGESLLGFAHDGRRLTTGWPLQGVTEWELTGPEDCLRCLPHGEAPSLGPWRIAFAPDGWLLASAGRDGVLLWDAVTGRLVDRLASGDGYALAFHPKGRSLFTTGKDGVRQWPIQRERDGRTLHIGPGTILRPAGAKSRSLSIAAAGTGDLLIVGAGDVDLVPLADPAKATRLGTHDDLFEVALSPDGRWAASAGLNSGTIRVWEVARAAVVRCLPHEGRYGNAVFSPDGRQLVTGMGGDFCFWDVATWELKHRLPGHRRSLFSPVAFAHDCQLLAVAHGRNIIHLRHSVTLRHLATLQTPDAANLTGLSLSPDGTRLAAATDYNLVLLWDLRQLRRELATLDLDWEMPPYPAPEPDLKSEQHLTVQVLPPVTGSR